MNSCIRMSCMYNRTHACSTHACTAQLTTTIGSYLRKIPVFPSQRSSSSTPAGSKGRSSASGVVWYCCARSALFSCGSDAVQWVCRTSFVRSDLAISRPYEASQDHYVWSVQHEWLRSCEQRLDTLCGCAPCFELPPHG